MRGHFFFEKQEVNGSSFTNTLPVLISNDSINIPVYVPRAFQWTARFRAVLAEKNVPDLKKMCHSSEFSRYYCTSSQIPVRSESSNATRSRVNLLEVTITRIHEVNETTIVLSTHIAVIRLDARITGPAHSNRHRPIPPDTLPPSGAL